MRLTSLSVLSVVVVACGTGPAPSVPDAPRLGDAAESEPDAPAETGAAGWIESFGLPLVVSSWPQALAIEVPPGTTAAGLGFVANEPSGEVWLGLYRAQAGIPTELVVQASGSVPSAGPTTISIPASPLPAGSYFLAIRSNDDAVTLWGTAASPTRYCEGYDSLPNGQLPSTFGNAQCTLQSMVWNVYMAPKGFATPPQAVPDQEIPSWAPGTPGVERLDGLGVLSAPITLSEPATLAEVGVVAGRNGGRYRVALYETDSTGTPTRFVGGATLARTAHEGQNVVDIIDRPLPAGRYQIALWYQDLEIIVDPAVWVQRCVSSDELSDYQPWPSSYGDATCADGASPGVFINVAR